MVLQFSLTNAAGLPEALHGEERPHLPRGGAEARPRGPGATDTCTYDTHTCTYNTNNTLPIPILYL